MSDSATPQGAVSACSQYCPIWREIWPNLATLLPGGCLRVFTADTSDADQEAAVLMLRSSADTKRPWPAEPSSADGGGTFD
ncbi:unnamed protein product [Arctogadus glacialis]